MYSRRVVEQAVVRYGSIVSAATYHKLPYRHHPAKNYQTRIKNSTHVVHSSQQQLLPKNHIACS